MPVSSSSDRAGPRQSGSLLYPISLPTHHRARRGGKCSEKKHRKQSNMTSEAVSCYCCGRDAWPMEVDDTPQYWCVHCATNFTLGKKFGKTWCIENGDHVSGDARRKAWHAAALERQRRRKESKKAWLEKHPQRTRRSKRLNLRSAKGVGLCRGDNCYQSLGQDSVKCNGRDCALLLCKDCVDDIVNKCESCELKYIY